MRWPLAWDLGQVPDLTGRVAVVTGANGGLGLQSARVLAAKGATVVTASRNQAKAAQADAAIVAESPAAVVEPVHLDLASQDSVRAAAAEILARHDSIDILLLNAGLMAPPPQQTADGFEVQLGVNHLGHWTLTALLLPAVLAAPQGRVVTVTSFARHFGRSLDPDRLHPEGSYDPWLAYGRSKLANYHFGLGLHDRFRAAGVSARSLLAHPGLTHSDLQSRTVTAGGGGVTAPVWAALAKYGGMEVQDGAMPQLRAATDPGAGSGELYGPRFGGFGPPVRLPVLRPANDHAIRTLWAVSERETGCPLTI